MKKKLLALVLVVALAVTSVWGATLAYQQDEVSNENVMTLGDVNIEQKEYNGDNTPFTQNQDLYPGVKLDKIVEVTNIGKRDAYVRTIIAIEIGSLAENLLTIEWENPVLAERVGTTTINGSTYVLYNYTYPDALVSGGKYTSLKSVTLSKAAGNDEIEAIDGDNDGNFKILVVSQAIQTQGWESLDTYANLATAKKALNTGFYTVTTTTHPWSVGTSWDGTADTEGLEENTDETNKTVQIYTAGQLAAFAAEVNGGNSYSGYTVTLNANIDLGNAAWTPIGDCVSGKYFQGTFDGQGYTISNLNVDKSTDESQYSAAGLFGWVDAAGATIKNVNVTNATVKGSHWVGVIAGYFTGRIENCSVTNSAVVGYNVNDEANGDKVGGIVGYLNEHSYINNNTVSNCTIDGNRDIGGIAGSVAASVYEMNNNQVTNTVISYVTAKDYGSAGEIVSGRTGYVANETNVATNVTIAKASAVTTAEELKAALSADVAHISVVLANDISIDIGTGWNMGGANTQSITIKGATPSVVLTLSSGYRSYFNLANSNGTLYLQDLVLTNAHTGTHFFDYTTHFNCDVVAENVDFQKAPLVNCVTAKFNNCEFNQPSTDGYGLWIMSGSTVSVTGGEVNSERGIKITDEDSAAAMTVLNVSGTEFNNTEKAAILATTEHGATITVNNIDISACTADPINAVWVDEDRADYADLVTVVGGTKIVEGNIAYDSASGLYYNGKATWGTYYVQNADDLIKAATYFAGTEHTSEANMCTIELLADIDLSGKTWNPWTVMWITFNGNGHTISNVTTSTAWKAGFFGYAGAVTINDLTLKNVNATGAQVGTFAGSAEGLKVNNSKLTGTNTVTYAAYSSASYTETWGGAGAVTGVLTSSTVNVEITSGTTVAVDKTGLTTEAAYVDTLTGYLAANSGTVTNNGTVTVTKNASVSSSAELTTAIADGATNIQLADGTYTLSGAAGKTLTISGTKDTKISVTSGLTYANGATVTFEGVTIESEPEGAGYTNGFADFKYAVFNNCVINGTLGLDFSCEFNNCEFNIEGNYYNVWTWGAGTATFNGCTFNCDGKALLVYANVLDNGTNHQTVNITDCVFNDNGDDSVTGKAAIEITNTYTPVRTYDVFIKNTKVNGFAQTVPGAGDFNATYGSVEGSNIGTNVWGNKMQLPNTQINIVIDGVDVY